MHVELCRMVTAWLQDPVEGLQAKLEALEPDQLGDFVPREVPFIATAMDDTGAGRIVAEMRDPPKFPAVFVTYDPVPYSLQGETPTGDTRDTLPGQGVGIAVRWLDTYAEGPKAEQARDAFVRALLRSLKGLLDTAGAGGAIRNGIELIGAERFDVFPLREKAGDAMVTAGVLMVCLVRDNAP